MRIAVITASLSERRNRFGGRPYPGAGRGAARGARTTGEIRVGCGTRTDCGGIPREGGGGAGDTGGTDTGAEAAHTGVRAGGPLVGAGAPLVGAPLVGRTVSNSTGLARLAPAAEDSNRLPSATTISGCSMASGGSPSVWCSRVATNGVRLAPPTRNTPASRPSA